MAPNAKGHRLREESFSLPPATGAPLAPSTLQGVGLGVDLVHIPTFAQQLATPGTRFGESFAGPERRAARRRAAQTGLDEAYHLAARWAGKEAFIKAWSSALVGHPPVVDEVDMAQIQISSDAYGRPYVTLTGEIAEAFAQSLPQTKALVSLSHDGEYAIAACHIVHAG